jgi:hypothetical protein
MNIQNDKVRMAHVEAYTPVRIALFQSRNAMSPSAIRLHK